MSQETEYILSDPVEAVPSPIIPGTEISKDPFEKFRI